MRQDCRDCKYFAKPITDKYGYVMRCTDPIWNKMGASIPVERRAHWDHFEAEYCDKFTRMSPLKRAIERIRNEKKRL